VAEKFEKTMKRLFSPIVAYNGWEDIITDEMKNNVLTERLANAKSETGTDMEAMVYLHTASLAAPLSGEMVNVYSYLFTKYYPKEAKGIGVYCEKMDDSAQRELTKLKDWIYKKQMK
jgi:hypothetical protein